MSRTFWPRSSGWSPIGRRCHLTSIGGFRISCADVSRKIARTVCVTLGTPASRFRKSSPTRQAGLTRRQPSPLHSPCGVGRCRSRLGQLSRACSSASRPGACGPRRRCRASRARRLLSLLRSRSSSTIKTRSWRSRQMGHGPCTGSEWRGRLPSWSAPSIRWKPRCSTRAIRPDRFSRRTGRGWAFAILMTTVSSGSR